MADEASTGLPASIEAAWGVRERPGKGPKPGLSLARIVEAAVVVATTDGLEAVSMGRVAKQLGAAPMALYRYVAAKDELLALMVDAAYGPPPQIIAAEGWRTGLGRWAHAHHEALLRHPWVLRIPDSGLPVTPHQVAWMDQALRSLGETTLDEATKLSVMILVNGFVRTVAQLAAQMDAAARVARETETEAMTDYGRQLLKLVDAERFPALYGVLSAGVLERDDDPPDAEFEFGLERILDGVGLLIDHS